MGRLTHKFLPFIFRALSFTNRSNYPLPRNWDPTEVRDLAEVYIYSQKLRDECEDEMVGISL